MLYLVACILSSTLIVVTFKTSKHYSCKLFNLIVINYLAATVLGFVTMQATFSSEIIQKGWIWFAMFIGILFIAMFFIIGKSTQLAGITITSVAAKMSMITPILFSLLYFNEQITITKVAGFLLAIISVIFSIFKKGKPKQGYQLLLLPAIIFIGTGFIDSIVKYVQETSIPENETGLFSATVFLIALLASLIISLLNKQGLKGYTHGPTLLFGIFLGVVNFGSLFFLIKALGHGTIDSSVVFAINNISIVSLSAIIGYIIFREKITRLNLVGIILAIVSIGMLTFL